jgi:hypothetical protein
MDVPIAGWRRPPRPLLTLAFAAVLAMPLALTSLSAKAAEDGRVLPIPPVMQKTWAWCWAAVGEMVFTHYGAANADPGGAFQCGIVESLARIDSDQCAHQCYRPECIAAAGTPAFLKEMLEVYPKRAALSLKTAQPRIRADWRGAELPAAMLRREIDAGRPVIAGVNPFGIEREVGHSAHVALIVGYEDGGATVIVNDPGPYPILEPVALTDNPYRAAGGEMLVKGRYRIAYRAFLRELRWIETLTVAADGVVPAPGAPNHCCTDMGRFGPYPYRHASGRPLRVGERCLGKHRRGLVSGAACH